RVPAIADDPQKLEGPFAMGGIILVDGGEILGRADHLARLRPDDFYRVGEQFGGERPSIGAHPPPEFLCQSRRVGHRCLPVHLKMQDTPLHNISTVAFVPGPDAMPNTLSAANSWPMLDSKVSTGPATVSISITGDPAPVPFSNRAPASGSVIQPMKASPSKASVTPLPNSANSISP